MNKNQIWSLIKKVIAVVVPLAVTQGWIDDVVGTQIPVIVDALMIIFAVAPTAKSSITTHK